MAQNTLNVSELDFEKIKNNLKNFMRAQVQFKDYDFEGSSLSILIDLLAYNTHYNGYYANMIANEMFLDTATYRESVVSRAKMLGYTPSSRVGAEVYVDLGVYIKKAPSGSAPQNLTLKKYSSFTSGSNATEYIFSTLEDNILTHNIAKDTSTAWYYGKNVVLLKEGTHISYQWEVMESPASQTTNSVVEHYIIPASDVDISTLVVRIQNSKTNTGKTTFIPASELQTVIATDSVYWVHEVEDSKYEIKFGDGGNIGKAIELGNIILLDYLVVNPDANNCKSFSSLSKSYSWSLSSEIVEDISLVATPVNYRVLELVQDYESTFIYGETVYGNESKASGEVEVWDYVNGILKLVAVNGVFNLLETVTGETSGTTGSIKMSSIEISKSSGGTEREGIESIKNLAPTNYQAQGRCVTAEDYSAAIKKIYPNIRAIKVWGGETANPPVYGKVFIALRPQIGQILSNYAKEYIRTEVLGKKNVITVQTEIVDPDYIYVIPVCNVKYNPLLTSTTAAYISQVVAAEIASYAKIYLNDFTAPFYYTNVSSNIDASDASIVSNLLTLKLKQLFEPTFNTLSTNVVLKYSNTIKQPVNIHSTYNLTTRYKAQRVIESSKFTYNGVSGCELAINPKFVNNLQVVKVSGDYETVQPGGENIGSIDYVNGVITIYKFKTSQTDKTSEQYPDFKGRIEVIVEPDQYDLFAYEHQILDILDADISVSVVDIRTLI